MTFKHVKEVCEAGYAWPEYTISSTHRCWRFHDEHFKVEATIPLHEISLNGELFHVPKIEDVRKNAI